jgi:hypothetical protein
MGGKVVNRGKIVRLQFRVVVKDFLLGHLEERTSLVR